MPIREKQDGFFSPPPRRTGWLADPPAWGCVIARTDYVAPVHGLGCDLHGPQRNMRLWNESHLDAIARRDGARAQYHSHDPSLANKLSLLGTRKDRGENTGLEALNLRAGVTKPSDPHQRARTDPKNRAFAEAEQRQARGGDVFAHLARRYVQACFGKFVEQLMVQQVNLPEVRLSRVLGYTRAVFDCRAKVCVSGDAVPLDQLDGRHRIFRKGVGGLEMNRPNDCSHRDSGAA